MGRPLFSVAMGIVYVFGPLFPIVGLPTQRPKLADFGFSGPGVLACNSSTRTLCSSLWPWKPCNSPVPWLVSRPEASGCGQNTVCVWRLQGLYTTILLYHTLPYFTYFFTQFQCSQQGGWLIMQVPAQLALNTDIGLDAHRRTCTMLMFQIVSPMCNQFCSSDASPFCSISQGLNCSKK